jgi:hypothetical protein
MMRPVGFMLAAAIEAIPPADWPTRMILLLSAYGRVDAYLIDATISSAARRLPS